MDTMKREFLHGMHPISSTAFEVFLDGYWHWIDHFSVADGFIYVDYGKDKYFVKERINRQDLRLRSRKAESFDCKFLRPGRDICLAAVSGNGHLVFRDAKISSVITKSHGYYCTCRYFVKRYQRKTDNDTLQLMLENDLNEVNMNHVFILQKVHTKYSNNGYRHWYASKDCFTLKQSKLLAGVFGSEITWLLVLSVLKNVCIDIKFMEDKIIYHILDKPDTRNEEALALSPMFSANLTTKIKVINIVTTHKKKTLRIEYFDHEFVRSFPYSEALEAPSSDPDCELEAKDMMDHCGLRRSRRLLTSPVSFTAFFPKRSSPRHVKLTSCQVGELSNLTVSYADPELKNHKTYRNLLSNDIENCADASISNIHTKSYALETSHDENDKTVNKSVKHCKTNVKSLETERHLYGSEISSLSMGKRSRDVFLGENDCRAMMRAFMDNIKSTMKKQTEISSSSVQLDTLHFDWDTTDVSPFIETEYETLWREMEYAHWLEEELLLQERSINCLKRNRHCADENADNVCKHEVSLDEEFGIECYLCKRLITERKYILPSFVENCSKFRQVRKKFERMDRHLHSFFSNDQKGPFLDETAVTRRKLSAWDFIPELEAKLYPHQRKAVEFLWKNIAESLLSNRDKSENSSGCIISHSPGTGKTFLVVSFLLSCLKGFSGLRPLILAPKTALSVWIKEFEKWKVPFPLYYLLPFGDYIKDLKYSQNNISLTNEKKLNPKMRHMLYCMKKLQKWHGQQSILLMSYSSFLSLSRGDKKGNHKDDKDFIAHVLLESTGLLILDEGHNPRSTRSKLRKLLMEVKTKSRILLSGTLFQNNFEEYFNTLCLAKPDFVCDVIKKLKSLNYKLGEKSRNTVRKNKEEFSRRLFIEEIGRRFESSAEKEQRRGFEMLMEMTEQFVDTHTSSSIENVPGLKAYIMILHPSEIQEKLFHKLQHLGKKGRSSWEVDLLVSLACIHPWLISTVSGVTRYFSKKELDDIEILKNNTFEGPKIRVVLTIILKAVNNGEKVLVFCRNITPITMLMELLEMIFCWKKGEDILVLHGDLDLSERAKVVDQFGNPKGMSKVLLASTTACSEGISLIAASRVVLLDLEWNHSRTKQAVARAFRHGQERHVYVYQLLAAFERKKYSLRERKEWLSKIISNRIYVEHASSLVHGSIDDDILKELAEKDQMEIFHMIV